MDKELLLLSAVEFAPEMSQRELAQQTGLSLGTINILMKKMIREGLIKLEKIPSDRVVYMMTPKGLEEKVAKTKAYIHGHYTALERMRIQLKALFKEDRFKTKTVILNIEQPELHELVLQVIRELGIRLSPCESNIMVGAIFISDFSSSASYGNSNDWVNLHEYLKL